MTIEAVRPQSSGSRDGVLRGVHDKLHNELPYCFNYCHINGDAPCTVYL